MLGCSNARQVSRMKVRAGPNPEASPLYQCAREPSFQEETEGRLEAPGLSVILPMSFGQNSWWLLGRWEGEREGWEPHPCGNYLHRKHETLRKPNCS